jgi:uncharacterized protein (TIGR00661 family)
MNIVYGVSGEGLGHVFEAREIVARLRREGHRVKVLTYGERALASLAEFGPTRIEGIQLYFNSRGMSLGDTVARNLHCIPFFLRNGGRLRRELAEFGPQVFLTAYEPFTMVCAHLLGRPLISMDNQNELLHIAPPEGTNLFNFLLARAATALCTQGAAFYIVKSFAARTRSTARVRFVSPIIQREIRKLEPHRGGHIFVYLTKPNARLEAIMRSMDERFIVYCNNRVGEDGNISYRAQGGTYLSDLAGCKAIIATTGFSLIADSIFLKKPYFGVPLLGQFEQTHNARFLSDSGLGEYAEDLSREVIERFLGRIPVYEARLARHRLDPSEQEDTLVGLLRQLEAGPPGPAAAV